MFLNGNDSLRIASGVEIIIYNRFYFTSNKCQGYRNKINKIFEGGMQRTQNEDASQLHFSVYV